ncbi:hypothetical protein FBF86_05425 [Serratia marcescens]|uniref:hypothetical protein n=1 Tax=Serratia marcescens TaxID=615 RepID=UPI0011513329|nr:hypothetical protein [Serratia marcescens]QDI17450.1 hypothetical protein FBF86_05425 [Serratia marcescens]QDI27193.1 hypothetical protein FG169_05425 [Serratia marcescens]
MTLTTEQLKGYADEFRKDAAKWDECGVPDKALELNAVADVFDNAAANREAQPVALVDRRPAASGTICWQNGGKDLPHGTELFTTPPAPAVPGIDELRLTFERSERESDDGFNLHKYGIGYADDATQARWESWLACRAAMLAQPVSSGYKLPDNVREALTLALQAMEFMGDTLNNIDAVCTEDVEYVTPAFNAVRELLAAAPEGVN